jgi:hypothetical protein
MSTFYIQEIGFTVHFWREWAFQRGFILRDTDVDLAVKRDGKLYNAIIGERLS